MDFSLQKANPWKRISAFLFDAICLSILAVGFGTLISLLTGYSGKTEKMNAAFSRYEQEYGVTFSITEETYEQYSEEEKAKYDAAYAALTADKEAMILYQQVVNLMLIMVTFSLLAAFLILEFIVPLKMGHGRSFGKKIFGLAVTDTDSVKLKSAALFVRSILGKYTIETMIPAYVIMMLFLNTAGLFGTILLLALLVIQIVMYFSTQTRSLLHDKLASSVVVDYASQMIFETREDMIEAKSKAAAEKAAHQEW